MRTSGKRWSTQVRTPLKTPASVTGGLLVTAMSDPLRVFADHDHRVARIAVRGDHEVLRRGRALEDARGEVEARVVAGAVVAPPPFGAHVGGRADLLLEGRRATQGGGKPRRPGIVGG